MFRDIGKIVGVDAIIKATGFLLLPVYLNLMSKAEFGEFSFYMTAISLIVPLITLSMYVPQIREFSSSKNEVEKRIIFSSTLNFVIIFFILFSLFIIVLNLNEYSFMLAFGEQDEAYLKSFLILVIIGIGAVNLILYSHVMSQKIPRLIISFNLTKFVSTTVFTLCFIYFGISYIDSTTDRMIGVIVGEIVTATIIFFMFSEKYWLWKLDLQYLTKAFKIALPMIPGGIATFIGMMGDRYFLNLFHGAEAVAEYNLAFQILLPIQMLMTAAQTTWAPHLFSIKDDKEALKQTTIFLKKVLVIFIIAIVFLWLIAIFAKEFKFIPMQYKDFDTLILLMSVSAISSALIHLPLNLFIRNGRTLWISYISVLKAILIIVVGYFVIQYYSYFGAAIILSVINIMILIISWYFASKYNKKIY